MSGTLEDRIEEARERLRAKQCTCGGILCRNGVSLLDDPQFGRYAAEAIDTLEKKKVPLLIGANQMLDEADHLAGMFGSRVLVDGVFALAVIVYDAGRVHA